MNKQKRPRVLMMVTLFSIGGATETVISLSDGLQKMGYQVDIVTGPPTKSEGGMFNHASILGLNVITIPCMVRNIHPIKDILTFIRLTRLIKKGSYEIIHTNSSKAGVLGRWAAKTAGAPVIVHTIHGLPFHEYQTILVRIIYILIERLCARISSMLVAVSSSIVEECIRCGIGTRNQFKMIRSGFDVEQFYFSKSQREKYRSKYQIEPHHVAIGTISRLAMLKGHDYILDIAPKLCQEYPHIKFVFIGDGEIRHHLETRVKRLGLQNNVIFTGLIDPEDIPGMIMAMDFILHVSLREGLARVLAQAVISGRKVVTFNIPGVTEVIDNDKVGYRISPKNKEELYKICRVLCSDEKMRSIEIETSRALADEFSMTSMVNQTSELYDYLLNNYSNNPNSSAVPK